MEEKKFDFEAFVHQAGEQLRSGKPFTGSDGGFTPLLKHILEASLEGELGALGERARQHQRLTGRMVGDQRG